MSDQDHPDSPTRDANLVRDHMVVQGSGNSTETPVWTADQLLYDLNDRINRGVNELMELRADSRIPQERARLLGKVQGLMLVRDWLRAYE